MTEESKPRTFLDSQQEELAHTVADNARLNKKMTPAIEGRTADGQIVITPKGVFEKKDTGRLTLIAPLDDHEEITLPLEEDE